MDSNEDSSKQNRFKSITQKLTLGYSLARTSVFAAQGVVLPWIDFLATGRRRKSPVNYAEHLKIALPKIQNLLAKDAENIANGLYPIQVLSPENPFKHTLRMPRIVLDALKSARRRNKKENKEFDQKANEYLEGLPDYYKRNFHFQTSGYLGDESAELYNHQVEILFSGAADAMRRLMIAPLKIHLQSLGLPQDGTGLKFLEIGAGTGGLTKSMVQAFPKAQITCLDLSAVYLAKAKENLKDFPRVDFVQQAGEKTTFKDQTFDAVYSCFMFHELPLEVRNEMIAESSRLLKASGFMGIVDSLQENDDAEFQWALEQFPQDFHEPFYKNYTQNPLEDLMSAAGLKNVQSEIGFLSKAVSAIKA